MTNLEKWKKEKIKEIEDMDIDDVAYKINNSYCEDFCINGLKEPVNGSWCKLPDNKRTKKNCLRGTKAYLEREVTDD